MSYCRFGAPANAYIYRSFDGLRVWIGIPEDKPFCRILTFSDAILLSENDDEFEKWVSEINEHIPEPVDELTKKTIRRSIRDYVKEEQGK